MIVQCEVFATHQQLKTLTAGVNTSHHDAYRHTLAQGFKIGVIGVAIHHLPHQDFYRPNVYVLDDRR